ncbi:MAG: hypothetical protein HYX65_09215 [Gemmatimonadetes bacterium]|nr:hypothetical protein [Gemmatimonadota bacterium]
MTRLKIVTTLAAAALALAPALSMAQAAAQDQRPTVAIMYFNNGSFGRDARDYDALGRGVADFLITEMAGNPAIRVVERDALDKIMKEQDLGASQRMDQETASRVGKLLGARYMVFGGFIADPKGNVQLNARAVNTETGMIVHTDAVSGKADGMMDVIRQLSEKLNKGMKLHDLPRRSAMAPAGGTTQVAAAPLPAKVPFAAVMLYSKGIKALGEGNKAEATTLFKKCVSDFPEFEKPKDELKKLGA